MQHPHATVTGASGRCVRANAIAAPPSVPKRLPSAPWPEGPQVPGQNERRQGNMAGARPKPNGYNGQFSHPSNSARQQRSGNSRRQDTGPGATPVQAGNPSDASITWLGTSSGSPTGHRNVSCTVVQLPEATYLVDCGEGTHRQLQQTNVDLCKVEGIFITHLHGDHCFGLPTTLQMIISAKATAVRQAAAAAAAGSSRSAPAVVPTTAVFGPPGIAELLRVSLVLTNEDQQLSSYVTVTELVLDPAGQEPSTSGRTPGPSSQGNGSKSPFLSASWDSLLTSKMTVAASGHHETSPSSRSSSSSARGGHAEQEQEQGRGVKLSWCSLGSRSIFEEPSLKAAAEAVRPGLQAMPSIWMPPRYLRDRQQPQASGTSAEPEYHGQNYLAAFGRYWELPCRHARVRAAQLQHRVPCWGYVIEELPSDTSQQESVGPTSPEPGAVAGRKVVIMGDTIASAPIAPLALGCDVISHEATFMAGMEGKCRVAQHSTAYLAGAFASCIQAKHLVLTHFSARYNTMQQPEGNRRGVPSTWRERTPDPEAEEEEQTRAITRLIHEARGYFSTGTICTAHDFFQLNLQRPSAAPAAAAPLRRMPGVL